MQLKINDTVFVKAGGSLHSYGYVSRINDDSIMIWVENGAYELEIVVDNSKWSGDYNEVMEQFKAKNQL